MTEHTNTVDTANASDAGNATNAADDVRDPRALIASSRNTRTELRDLDQLTDSIRALGVIEPLVITHTEAGDVILAGHRRAAAAIAADLPTVPVIVRNDLAGDLDQLAVVLAENESRDALTMGEQVAAVQQMLDLGSNAAAIGRKTGLPLRRLRNISRIAKSTDDVREAIDTYQPTLDQAVTLTKYADDAELLTQLIAALESPGQFALLVRRAEEEKRDHAALATAITEYAEQGITAHTFQTVPEEATRLHELDVTEADHADCPHRAMLLRLIYDGRIADSEICLDPTNHPRRSTTSNAASGGEVTAEDLDKQKLKRRQTIANNKAFAISNDLRREWLAALLRPQRPKLGTNSIALIASLYAQFGGSIRYAHYSWNQTESITAIGWTHGEPTTDTPAATATGYLFAMIASAIEGPINKSGWRSDPKTLRAWLTVLDSLGYNLTAIENAIQKGKIDTYTAD